MNGQLAFDDCMPDWPEPAEPGTRPPSRWTCRDREVDDLDGQGVTRVALRAATNVPTQEYL